MASSGPAAHLRYHNKVVIVTGGTKGIGEAIVRIFGYDHVAWICGREFAAAKVSTTNNGASVVFCSKEEMTSDLEAELKSSGTGAAIYVSCDVTKEEEIKRLIDVTVKTYGKIDCLINNAGWHPPEQIIDNTSAQEFQDLLNLNLIGYFLTAKYALPHLRKTKGNIINMSSLVGIIGQKHAIPYVATKNGSTTYIVPHCIAAADLSIDNGGMVWKGAVTAMTKAMAVDESQYNVRVNSISPGNIWTPLWEELASHSTDPDAMILGGKDAQLLGRMGTVEECANAVLYLAAEGTFCTGIDVLLTGGAELNYANKNQQKTRSSIYH